MLFVKLKKFLRKRKTAFTKRLVWALVGAILLNFFFGFLFYLAEHEAQPKIDMWDSIWWSMVTMTTVGYGGLIPQTFIGRFFVAYPCFLIGIGLIGYLLGTFAESMLELTSRRRKGQLKSRMKNHVIICHCPSENKLISIVTELRASPHYDSIPITVIDPLLETQPASFAKHGLAFVKGDPTDENVLMRAGLKRAEGVVILAQHTGDPSCDSRTFAIGAVIEMVQEEIDHPIKTVAEVISARSTKLFKRSEIDGTVIIEGISDKMMVQEFLHPGIAQTFEQLLTNTTGSQFYSCKTKLVGRTFLQLQKAVLEHDHELQIVGLRRAGSELLNPPKLMVIKETDELIVLAESQHQYFRFEADALKV